MDIYKGWDENRSGKINAQNVKSVLERMNIPINDKEAEILVASADQNNSKDLNASEFYNFIFDEKSLLSTPKVLSVLSKD